MAQWRAGRYKDPMRWDIRFILVIVAATIVASWSGRLWLRYIVATGLVCVSILFGWRVGPVAKSVIGRHHLEGGDSEERREGFMRGVETLAETYKPYGNVVFASVAGLGLLVLRRNRGGGPSN